MSTAQFSYRIRVQARFFRQIGIGNFQAALRLADDVAEIILEWNVHAPVYFSSLRSGMFIVYRPKNSQALSERQARMRDHSCVGVSHSCIHMPRQLYIWRAYGA